MKRTFFLVFTLFCIQVNAQKWDNWFDKHSWSYEKIYPGKYASQDVIEFEEELDSEKLEKALAGERPKKVLILKYFKSIPEEIFQLNTIEVLEINYGDFSMDELNNIDQFEQLKAVNLFHTAKSYKKDGYTYNVNKDALPASFGSLKNLEYLRLYNNGIEEPIPDEFGNLTNLKQLQIASQPALILPASINRLKNLKVASFYHINEDGVYDLPPSFFELSQLVSLELGMIWSESSDLSSYEWSNLSSLQELQLGTYSGVYRKDIPQAVYELPNLKRLYFPSGRPLSKKDRSAFKAANKNLKIIKIK